MPRWAGANEGRFAPDNAGLMRKELRLMRHATAFAFGRRPAAMLLEWTPADEAHERRRLVDLGRTAPWVQPGRFDGERKDDEAGGKA